MMEYARRHEAARGYPYGLQLIWNQTKAEDGAHERYAIKGRIRNLAKNDARFRRSK